MSYYSSLFKKQRILFYLILYFITVIQVCKSRPLRVFIHCIILL